MSPLYADTLETWDSTNPKFNLNNQSAANLRRTPLRNSTLLTPDVSWHALVLEYACTLLHVYYLGDLLLENGR
jgi:hypothetical protein